MLYQLSHIRIGIDNLAVESPDRTTRPTANASALIGRPEVDAERQDAVLDRRFGVPDDREVLEVELRLLEERLSFLAGDGRERALLHRSGAAHGTV